MDDRKRQMDYLEANVKYHRELLEEAQLALDTARLCCNHTHSDSSGALVYDHEHRVAVCDICGARLSGGSHC